MKPIVLHAADNEHLERVAYAEYLDSGNSSTAHVRGPDHHQDRDGERRERESHALTAVAAGRSSPKSVNYAHRTHTCIYRVTTLIHYNSIPPMSSHWLYVRTPSIPRILTCHRFCTAS